MAELILGQPFFPGDSGIDQLVEIIKILGTPARQDIAAMNPSYVEHRFPQIKRQSLSNVKIVIYSQSDNLFLLIRSLQLQRLRQLTC